MTDRELLEAAAKAAGIEIKPHTNNRISPHLIFSSGGKNWNPLIDDGDALLLAVKLGMTIVVGLNDGCTRILNEFEAVVLRHMHWDDGPEAATRRAIVRAAASLLPDGGPR